MKPTKQKKPKKEGLRANEGQRNVEVASHGSGQGSSGQVATASLLLCCGKLHQALRYLQQTISGLTNQQPVHGLGIKSRQV
jgi:hypothetical protein